MRSNTKTSVQPVENLSNRALRTREKLKIATRVALNEIGFHRMRVQDITEGAGVAAGLFYRYFSDVREIVREICEDFMDELNAVTRNLPALAHPYDQIFERHTLAVEMFSNNPGIIRCLFQHDDDFPEFGQVWKAAAHEWNLQVADILKSHASMPSEQAEHMAYVLGAMTEGVFFQYLIRHTKDLFDMGREPKDIAEIIAIMWYRTIFLEDPPADKLNLTNPLIINTK
ncbi:MAG: TetR/AcrR family transcriptional regulator [Gammaproteobacteria bacterium]|nr:TetR/AcrR family transcriptional regulator [Gammaproteobacteria bacterium]